MVYQYWVMAAAGAAFAFTGANLWSVHQKWKAYDTWRGAGFAHEWQYARFRHYHNLDSASALGLILSFSACYLITVAFAHKLISEPIAYHDLLRFSALAAFLCLLLCAMHNQLRQRIRLG